MGGGGIGDGVEITKDKNIMGGIGKNGVCVGGNGYGGGNILLSLLMMIMNHSSICYGIILIILLCFIL